MAVNLKLLSFSDYVARTGTVDEQDEGIASLPKELVPLLGGTPRSCLTDGSPGVTVQGTPQLLLSRQLFPKSSEEETPELKDKVEDCDIIEDIPDRNKMLEDFFGERNSFLSTSDSESSIACMVSYKWSIKRWFSPPKPINGFTTIPDHGYHQHTAPHHQSCICFELLKPYNSKTTINNQTPTLSEDIGHVDIIERGLNGFYYLNMAHIRPHYDIPLSELDSFTNKITSTNKTFHVMNKDDGDHYVQNGSNFILCCNSDRDIEAIVEMELEKVIDDLFVEGGLFCNKDGNRGNRGYSLGYTGNQNVERHIGEDAAKPKLIVGTMRYKELFISLTRFLMFIVEQESLPAPFHNEIRLFQFRKHSFAAKIDDENVFESLSIRCLVHGDGAENDRLLFHVDGENCPQVGWDGCFVVYRDFWVTAINRWVTLTLIGTSRKSVSDSILRKDTMKDATRRMMGMIDDLPLEQVEITNGSFGDFEDDIDWVSKKIHCQTTVHLSVCVNGILAVAKVLPEDKGISKFLILEMIYAFVRTNNPLRFHSYVQEWLELGEDYSFDGKWSVPLEGEETFVGLFLSWCINWYGSCNGTSGQKRATLF